MKIDISASEKKQKNEKIEYKINFIFYRYFKWLILIIMLMIFIFGYIFVIDPKYKEIVNKKKEDSHSEESEYFGQKRKIKKLNDLINIYKNIDKDDIKKIDLLLPSEEKIHEELFSQIESIILRNGLLLKSLEIEPEEKSSRRPAKNSNNIKIAEQEEKDSLPAEIGKINVSLDILGVDYFKLKDLLKIFENNLRLIDVTEINFQPNNDSANIYFYTYYLKNK